MNPQIWNYGLFVNKANRQALARAETMNIQRQHANSQAAMIGAQNCVRSRPDPELERAAQIDERNRVNLTKWRVKFNQLSTITDFINHNAHAKGRRVYLK